MDKVPVTVYGQKIPNFLSVDFRGKKVGDKVMASEVHLPDGVKFRDTKHDFAVVRFMGSKRGSLQDQQKG